MYYGAIYTDFVCPITYILTCFTILYSDSLLTLKFHMYHSRLIFEKIIMKFVPESVIYIITPFKLIEIYREKVMLASTKRKITS